MSITKTILAGAAGTVLATGMAAAGEPMKLSTTEMDQVTAGFFESFATVLLSSGQGISGSFSESVFANGRETTTINSTINFASTVAANAGATATGTGTGGVVGSGENAFLVEGLFTFGGLLAESIVATEVF